MEKNVHHWSRRSRIIWKGVLFFGSVFVYCTRTTMSVCAVQMGQELGWDKRISGFVMSTFFFGYILTQIVGGILADRYGGDQMMFIAACIWSLCTMVTPFVGGLLMIPDTIGIGLAQAIAGVTQGVHFPSLASLVGHKVPDKHRNSAFSFVTSGTNIGNLFTGSVGSIILEYNGWRTVFVCFGTLSLFWALVVKLLLIVEKMKGESSLKHSNNVTTSVQVKDSSDPIQWRKVLTCIPFWALFFTTSCESFVFTTLVSWLPTYFHEMYPKSKPWVYNVLPWVSNFLASNIAGIISDRMVSAGVSMTKLRKAFVCSSMFTCTLLCLIITRVNSFHASLVLITLLCFFVGLNTCGIGMNPQDLMPNHSGVLYGIMNTAAAVSGMVGVSLMGEILHATQNWSNSFIAISISAFSGGFIYLLFGSGQRIG